ncbi:MAG TPA: hypothetical protein VK177_16105 [Flavobacteriales bacterium]|nr:hypothetical protein [Flavobacteriales bacterium]
MKKLHYILFGLLFLAFMFPALQQFLGIFKEVPLEGAFKEPAYKRLTAKNWFGANFQKAAEKKSNYVIGFRTDFVRTRNQVDFSLFDIAHSVSVVKGKNGHLFRYEDYYVKGATNKPENFMVEQVKRLKAVQDSLKAKGKFMLYVIAPDKLYYWKEFLPQRDVLNKKSMYTYTYYKRLLKKYGCDFIDMNQWFLQLKSKTAHTLYSKGGFHWTQYGASIAYDSMVNYIRTKTSFTIPKINVTGLKKEKNPWGPDVDIFKACNLFIKPKEDLFTYPTIVTDTTQCVTTAIVCADSYFHAIAWPGFYAKTFSPQSTFWYYNREVSDPRNKNVQAIKDVKTNELIEKSNVYIILFSTMNMDKFDYGFLEHFGR